MSMTGLPVFDETVHATNTWLHEITSRMGWDNRQKGYRLLRASLHALRDRMPLTEAAQFSAQLPILLRGVFYEGWRPGAAEKPPRTRDAFLAGLREAFVHDPEFDAEAGFREVIAVMRLHITAGELEDMRRVMPEDIKGLWEEEIPG